MRLSIILASSALLAATIISACKKDAESTTATTQSGTAATSSSGTSGYNLAHGLGRYSGEQYSQSISVEMANTMISSYLKSVRFPAQDTAVRSFAFDADTLRSYLADTSIKTIRFHMAHTPAQVQSGPGVYTGFRPQSLTMIIVGYSENDAMIRNRYNGVYEHLFPCPYHCGNSTSGLLQ